jgi:hypothetical protein
LTEEQITQAELSQTLPWIALSPAQHNSSIPLDLDNRTLDELLDPAQFATADEVEQFFIATPRPAMSLALANAQMEMEHAQAKVAAHAFKMAELNLAKAQAEAEAEAAALGSGTALQQEAEELLAKQEKEALEKAEADLAPGKDDEDMEPGSKKKALTTAKTRTWKKQRQYNHQRPVRTQNHKGNAVIQWDQRHGHFHLRVTILVRLERLKPARQGNETPYHTGPEASGTSLGGSTHNGVQAFDTTVALNEATLMKIVEMNQLAIHQNIETSMAPVLGAIKNLQQNSVQKSDLRKFKEEWRKEVEDAFAKDAQWSKASAEKEDPFLRHDPWRSSEGLWGTWSANQAAQSSSSEQAPADQGGTSQIPRGKWRPDGDKANTAVGAAADKFHQQQQHMASSSSSWIPSQVFVRGWSNWGDAQGISKTTANEILDHIKRELEPDVERLIINTTMFDPIQRIAIHVMETPGAAVHVRDKIQQVVSRKNLQQDWKDLQIVIQKPPEIRKMNGELNENIRKSRSSL